MMYKLKDCPFCGSKRLAISEKSVQQDSGTSVQYRVAVYCRDCNAYGPRVLSGKFKKNVWPPQKVDMSEMHREATNFWDRRTENDRER
jgi:hypothetical protein